MFQRIMHVLLGTTFIVFLGIQAVWAVSFGKMDVASKMGEPFYAEIPLRLSEAESLKKTSVGLGSIADYRILEVYRNPVINAIRTDVVDDERGPRVTLSSESAIDEPFFNLVLKVRYGRSTHYKKIPVFLDEPTATTVASKVKPLPAVDSANVDPDLSTAFVTKVPEGAPAEKPAAKEAFEDIDEGNDAADTVVDDRFTPYDGWARTSRYGPMVYGDTITIVAKRLRVDDRFTNQQVMVALFEKNKAKFSKNNINLIKAGVYLDVPTAQEVSQISPEEARQVLAKHRKAWFAMQKDPKYAALAEAQRNRYSRRVRIGDTATGTAKEPMATSGQNTSQHAGAVVTSDKAGQASGARQANTSAQARAAVQSLEEKLVQKDLALTALQEKMTALEEALKQAKANQTQTSQGDASAATSPDATAAALEAQNKRMELVITRLKAQLEAAKANANQTPSSMADWVLYALAGLAGLVLALLAAVFVLMRKNRAHPAEKEALLEEAAMDAVEDVEEEASEDFDATKVMDADDFEMPSEANAEHEDEDSAADLFSDGDLEEIPDLTDEETGEIEPFNADADEIPDPNVNYLEDADVYMRYGMEDEAEAQVRMALKLQEDNPEAHAKMVQIQKAKGDEEAVKAAISAAKVALTGSALALFESAIADEDSIADQGSENDTELKDLPVVSTDDTSDDGMEVEGLDFGGDADVILPEHDESSDSDIDFDFSDIGKVNGEQAESDTIQDADEAMPDLDVDFDIADLGSNDESADASDNKKEAGEPDNLNSSELDEVEIDGLSEDEVEAFTDSLKDIAVSDTDDEALDFADIDFGETAEVDLDAGTQLVSTDGDSLEEQDGLNDFEIDKAKAEAEAEKNATAVDIDVDSDDPFAAANQALDEKSEDQVSVDLDIESVGSLTGEEEDPLSLTDEKAEEIADDGTAEVELEDLDLSFDLPDLDAADAEADTDEADSTFVMDSDTVEDTSEDTAESEVMDLDEESSADAGVSLDDMDFDLPDLDTADADVMDTNDDTSDIDLDVSMDEGSDDIELTAFEGEDIDSLDAGMDNVDISTTTIDPVKLGYTEDDLSDDTEADEMDMLSDLDADLSALEMHEESIISDVDKLGVDTDESTSSSTSAMLDDDDDLDKTFILNDVAKNKAMLEEGVESSASKEDDPHFASLDDALDSTSSVADTDNPMEEGFSSTAELDAIHETLDSIESLKDKDNDPMVETFGASQELDDLMKDLDGLLDEDKDKS